MDSDRRARADAALCEALDRPEEEREAFVRSRCGDDAELARLVLELLADAEAPDDGFLRPGQPLEGPLWQRALARLEGGGVGPGTTLGAWVIVRKIGAGGMAEVYLARRSAAEFEQQAALKLIKRGIDTDEVAHRFRQERQILASLEHANIARLLDGGVSPDGRPYFVMEYIDGLPIDRWCDERGASVEKRLALFLDVARAVEQAHRKLVVHRDIKAGNVLVDAHGSAKLLDFGIAKLLDPAAAAQAPATRTSVRVMTPEYASPEQVRGEPATVASDVYQLGLLLYELLTGSRAHRLGGASLTEIERAVCEELPARPSTVVGGKSDPDTSGSARDVARARGASPEALRRRLRGDLDNIVLKALSKEPDARYASVSALIDDLERHLGGRPVAARRPTVPYRAGRFVRRHAVGVTAAALVVASLLAGLAATLWQARIAQIERDNARREAATAGRVSEFLIETFQIADPSEARGNSVTAREVLDNGTRRIEVLSDQPEVQATMKDVMGRVYQSLGLYDRAGPLLSDALEMRRARQSGPDARVADSLDHVGLLWIARGNYDEASTRLRAGLQMRRALHGEAHEEVAVSLRHLAYLEHIRENLDEAGRLLDEALAIRRRVHPGDHREIAALLKDQGMLWLQRGDPRKARALLESALPMQRRSMGDHPAVAETLNSLGMVAQNLDRLDDASRHYNEALKLRTRILGPTHPDTSATRNNLAALYYQQSDFARAAPIFRENLEEQRSALGDDHPSVATSRNNLAVVLAMLGRLDEAEPEYREALRIRRKAYGEGHRSVASTRYHLGRLLGEKGEVKEAEALMRGALEQLPAGDPNLPACQVDLGELLLGQGRLHEAGRLLHEAVRSSGEINGAGHWWTAAARSARGAWRLKRGETAAAEEDLAAAWAVLEGRPEGDRRRRLALERMLDLFRSNGDAEKAAETRAKLGRSSRG